MSKHITELKFAGGKILFDYRGGGLPTALHLFSDPQGSNLVRTELVMTLTDGRSLHPVSGTQEPIYRKGPDCETLEFTDLCWQDEHGLPEKDFHLSLRHELYRDGAFFTTAMFHGESPNPPGIRDFHLSFQLSLDSFSRIRGAAIPHRGTFASKDIQSGAFRKIIPCGENYELSGNLLASAGFYATRDGEASLYSEFFLEGSNSLSGQQEDSSSTVVWEGSSPRVSWYFQNGPAETARRPWQWRNRWGWIIAPPPTGRKHPPMEIYQYIDNYKHYPDQKELEEIVEGECQLLVLHSNWRRDAKNGGVPYDLKRLREIIDYCHIFGVRIALYVRGNEKEIREEAARWFENYLKKNYDGLYIDYCSPLCQTDAADEDYPGGCICFWKYYQLLKALRRRVGDRGLIISHTGADFSALGLALTDGYISGEAEHGILLKNRYEHEFYSMAGAATGTLWSAAFPEYSTLRIIPFLAATGQAPHSPLGVQFISSSLQHPPVPGINDQAFRPLWRLWRLFHGEKDVYIFNDYNCTGIFSSSDSIGHYLMVSQNETRALLLLADFGAKGPESVTVDWEKAGFDLSDMACWRLCPGVTGPKRPEDWHSDSLISDFSGYPVMAFYWGRNWDDLIDYELPYPVCGKCGQAYLQKIADQRKLRMEQTNNGSPVIRVLIDNQLCTSLEDSNFFDLFDNQLQLLCLDSPEPKVLGEIGRNGLYAGGSCPKEDQLQPGEQSRSICLTDLLPAGVHHLGIRSLHQGLPFYSLISLQIKNSPGEENWRQLDFYNDLEPDRSLLTWDCKIQN